MMALEELFAEQFPQWREGWQLSGSTATNNECPLALNSSWSEMPLFFITFKHKSVFKIIIWLFVLKG
jgi:hypothetical protein